MQKIELTAFDSAYTRILSLFIHLGERFGEKQDEEYSIKLPLSHYTIALFLGMRRETISRRLAFLQKKGIIRYENEHIVLTSITEVRRELKRSQVSHGI